MLALVDGVPRTLRLDQFVTHWIDAPDRGHPAAHPLPPAQGRGARPHPARLPQGARRARRGHRADPARRRPSRTRATGLMELLDIDEIQATAILDMQLRRLAALERQKIIDEYDRARGEDRRLQGHPGQARRASAPIVARRARRDRRQVRRRAAHRGSSPADGDVHRRGPHRRGGRGRHHHRGRLRQAHQVRPVPLAAPRRQGRARRGAAAGRRRRALLRHDHPPLDPVLHQPGPRLPREGVRAARGRPRRQGPARRQPAGVPAGRADRPGAGDPRTTSGAVPACWPPGRAGEEDPADRVRLQPHRRDHRDQPARRRRADRRAARGRRPTTCCWCPRKGSRCGSRADDAAAARWAGPPPGSSACGSAATTRCWRWTSCARTRTWSRSPTAGTPSARRSTSGRPRAAAISACGR